MDGKDLEIIKVLQANARTPFLEIAKKLRMSVSAVIKRVKRLEREGAIEKYTAVVNPSKLGYNAVAIVGLDVSPDKYLVIVNALAKLDEVRRVTTSTGDHMIMVEVWARDNRELTDIVLQKIGKLEGVTRICPAIILERIK
ncbi:MAG: winged helix-turn-helix transcriptional regulator [Candidatus Hadarchaeales archaeon]